MPQNRVSDTITHLTLNTTNSIVNLDWMNPQPTSRRFVFNITPSVGVK